MADFDPEAFVAKAETGQPFDPDAFLAKAGSPAEAQAPVTLGAGSTGAFHAARHLAFGLGDKIIAAEQALNDTLHDKTGKVHLGDAYKRDLAFNDQLLEDSDKAHPVARWVGNGIGLAGSSAALAAPGLLRAGAAGAQVASAAPRAAQLLNASKEGAKVGRILGALGGYGGDRSDSTLGTVVNTAIGGIGGDLLGRAAPYVAEGVGRGAQWLGGKVEDAAGWLKVHSLHPTPKLGEAMADLPGGEVAVGKELLERGVGGLTKKGTAQQAAAETAKAGKVIDALAADHDARGGAPISLDDALAVGRKEALAKLDEPTTEAAGKRLLRLVTKYEKKHGGQPVSAQRALELKRALGDEAYGADQALQRAGDKVAGDYAPGVGAFERAVDSSLDNSLGPKFEEANLSFRRLLGAKQAAERAAARAQTNHIFGLIPHVAGAGVVAAGHSTPEALAYGAGTALLGKYGTQLGARALYSPVAGTLRGAGALLQALPSAADSALASEGAGAMSPSIGEMLRPAQQLPAVASDDDLRRRSLVAALRAGR